MYKTLTYYVRGKYFNNNIIIIIIIIITTLMVLTRSTFKISPLINLLQITMLPAACGQFRQCPRGAASSLAGGGSAGGGGATWCASADTGARW